VTWFPVSNGYKRTGDPADKLQLVETGERSLWVLEGQRALLACVVRGILPVPLRDQLQSVLEQIHECYK
jgi:hypothetical protein